MTLSKTVGMDPSKALAEMKRFAIAPERCLVPIVASAVACGANYAKVTLDAGGTVVDFDGRLFTETELEELFSAPFDNGPRALRELAIGVNALLANDPSWVTVESWDGSQGARLRIEGGKQKTERLGKTPWKEGTRMNRVRVQSRKGWRPFQGLFSGGKSEEIPPEGVTLGNLCAWAPLNLEVNGNQVARPVDLGRSLVWVDLESDSDVPGCRLRAATPDTLGQRDSTSPGSFSAVLAIGGEPNGHTGLTILVNGVSYPKQIKSLEELGVRGVVAAPELALTDDHTEIQENSSWEELLASLEGEVLHLGTELAAQFDRMNSLDRVEATEYIKFLCNLYRETGALDEAEALTEKLLQGQEDALGDDDPELGWTLCKLAELREEQGRAEECIPLYERALEIFETSKPDPQIHAQVLAGLAQIHYLNNNLEPAEDLARQALEVRKSNLDAEDPQLGASYEQLARIYRAAHVYPARQVLEVDGLYSQALKIFERNFGASHLDVATILHDQADHRKQLRRYSDAEPLLKRCLKIREEHSDGVDQMVAETLDSLGTLYEEQGRSTLAGQHYRRALEMWTELLGDEHPDVAQRLNNLVVLYRIYGKFAEAEPLYVRILDIRERALGPDHLDLVPDLSNLALLYQAQYKFDKAEPLFKRSLDILEASMEEEGPHPDVAWILNHMGELLNAQGRYEEAESVTKRALAMWPALLGDDHPDTAVCLDSLVRNYRMQRKWPEAEEYASQSVALKERALGDEDPETLTSLGTLAEILRHSGNEQAGRDLHRDALVRRDRRRNKSDSGEVSLLAEFGSAENSRYSVARLEAEELEREAAGPAKQYNLYPEAEHLYLRALFAREQALGPNHPDIAHTLDLLANLYRTHHKFEGAEELYQRTLQLRKRALGDTHPDVALSLVSLLHTLLSQRKFGPAEPLAREWLQIIENTVGGDHPEAAAAYTQLADIYGAAGNREKQEEFHKQAMEIRHAALGTEHPDFATSLADLMMVQQKYEDASRLYNFVVNSLEENMGPEAAELIPVYEKYADCLKKLNRESTAVELETQAMVLRVMHGLDFGD